MGRCFVSNKKFLPLPPTFTKKKSVFFCSVIFGNLAMKEYTGRQSECSRI